MTVLMEERHSDGSRRQCNARCHNAKGPKCRCICGGRYHGAGRNGTLEQKVKEFTEMVAAAAQECDAVQARVMLF